jgi:hypothetical protein
MTAFPLTGPHRASGHASNVFRRSAAHSFGLHATPAAGITVKTVAVSSSPTPIAKMDIGPIDTRVSGLIASVESTEDDSDIIGAPIPLEPGRRKNSIDVRRWTLLRFERDLCFFLGGPKASERQLADPLLGDRPHSKLPRTTLDPALNEVTFEQHDPRRSGQSFGPCLNDEGETCAPVRCPERPCNLFLHLPVKSAKSSTKRDTLQFRGVR